MSTVWEDLAVWNADFLALFPCLKVTDLNRLEREMLNSLEFVVGLKASMYARTASFPVLTLLVTLNITLIYELCQKRAKLISLWNRFLVKKGRNLSISPKA